MFEKKFSKFIGNKYSVAICNGTVALEVAIKSLDLPKKKKKDLKNKISQTSEEFYQELKTNPIHPKTSQPPAGDFINKFEYGVAV